MELYFFGWPANVGGAATKFYHTLHLLAPHYRITVVPFSRTCLQDKRWCRWLEDLGIRCAMWSTLPRRLEGWAVAFCQKEFFSRGYPSKARARGLKVAWSNDMMWHFKAELGSLFFGLIDTISYVSQAQRLQLEPGYRQAIMVQDKVDPGHLSEGLLHSQAGRTVRWVITGNYINPDWFPFRDRFTGDLWREKRGLTVGRLSRADPDKFPDNFPAFYEGLDLTSPRFRVMAWDDSMFRHFRGHRFNDCWELLPPRSESQTDFLHSLDLFVYSVSGRFRESWGRAVVEAMLTGAVPLVPGGGGHHLENLVSHGVSGFICGNETEYGHYARLLQDEPDLRRRMSFQAREWAVNTLCDRQAHLALWQRAFA